MEEFIKSLILAVLPSIVSVSLTFFAKKNCKRVRKARKKKSKKHGKAYRFFTFFPEYMDCFCAGMICLTVMEIVYIVTQKTAKPDFPPIPNWWYILIMVIGGFILICHAVGVVLIEKDFKDKIRKNSSKDW